MKTDKNFYSDNDDIRFHMEKSLDFTRLWELLTKTEKEAIEVGSIDEYKKTWVDGLALLGEIAGSTIAPTAREVEKDKFDFKDGKDVIPPTLKANMDLLIEYGLPGFGIAPEFGGMGAPFFLTMIGAEILNRACPSTMLNVSWYASIAHVIDQFGTDELKQNYIPALATGETSGNMAMTEADAGSDLGSMRTYGVKQKDGSWTLHGTKRFITNGTSQVSLVLAMSKKGAKGLDKLSLFLCPRVIDGKENIKVLGLEDKVGLRASPTAELLYDGSKAWILGKEGEGFRYMLRLMNDSRIGVGFQGLGLMEATLQLAKNYASERKSWGRPIAEHELVAEMLLDMEVELKAVRSLAYKAAFKRTLFYAGERALRMNKMSAKKKAALKKEIAQWNAYVRTRTPLIKYWVGEKSPVHARTCLQIFGGYGFTTEYDPERWLRESLIYSLYEGTSQMQALMSLKDTLKEVVRSPKKFVESLLTTKVKGLGESNPLRRKLLKIRQVRHSAIVSVLLGLIRSNAQSAYAKASSDDILKIIKTLARDLIKFEDVQPALVHAERLCEMLTYEMMAESLIEDAELDKSRSWVAERYLYLAAARVTSLKSMIDANEPVLEGILRKQKMARERRHTAAQTNTAETA